MAFSLSEYTGNFKFHDLLKFDFGHLKGDIAGGITSAVVALPLALGFGILAYGGDPRGAVAGLYGAVFTGFLASFFGGTPRQITGPTGGMTVILTMVYKQYGGPDALLGACLIAGLLQIGYGFLKVGRFISFVPYPVIVGFTNGIAMLIFWQQLPSAGRRPGCRGADHCDDRHHALHTQEHSAGASGASRRDRRGSVPVRGLGMGSSRD